MKEQAQPPSPPGLSSAARPWFKIIWIWGLPIACIILIAAIPIAFAIGAVIGNTQVYHIFSERQQARIEQYLVQHPAAFGQLSVEHASNGWAYPVGVVSSQADYDMLAAQLHVMFGDELALQMMNGVSVDPSG